jgi:TolB-like protein
MVCWLQCGSHDRQRSVIPLEQEKIGPSLMTTFDLPLPLSDATASKSSVCESGIAVSEIHAALNDILASTLFFRSHRMSRLLQFLVKKALADEVRATNEYAIGIEVFDRNPTTYSTYEDPIVRVQVGRLREKLNAYYAGTAAPVDVIISIPVGKYMPVIRRPLPGRQNPIALQRSPILTVVPLIYISTDSIGQSFTRGLCEELSYRLFRDFDYRVVPHNFVARIPPNQTLSSDHPVHAGISHFLEGSIRVEGDRMRASFRLIDAVVGDIAWATQFDRNALFSISVQEELSIAIGSDLQLFFGHV